jgi:hypothetical protein
MVTRAPEPFLAMACPTELVTGRNVTMPNRASKKTRKALTERLSKGIKIALNCMKPEDISAASALRHRVGT